MSAPTKSSADKAPYYSGPFNRCDRCRVVIPDDETRCEECIDNGITPAIYEDWAAACDSVRSDI